jgi:ABC-type branched-subunit amino acid transport system permease subunit
VLWINLDAPWMSLSTASTEPFVPRTAAGGLDWALIAVRIAGAALVVPVMVDEYLFRAILIPFLILSLAALGLNILVGYCGQISLGTGAFMAVGAYAAYNFSVRIDGMPLLLALLLGGACATVVGVLIEVPVMLMLVRFCTGTRHWFPHDPP